MAELPPRDAADRPPGQPHASGVSTTARPDRDAAGSGYSTWDEEGFSGWAWFTGGLMGLVGAFGHARRVTSGLGTEACRGAQVAVALVEVGRHGAATRDVVGHLGQRRESRRGAVGLADRDGPVEPHDR